MAEQKCGNCRFFHWVKDNEGHCRRFPPVNLSMPVHDFLWCGEWDAKHKSRFLSSRTDEDADAGSSPPPSSP